jgi:hypothetical protein
LSLFKRRKGPAETGVEIRIESGVLWIGSTLYNLKQIARVFPFEEPGAVSCLDSPRYTTLAAKSSSLRGTLEQAAGNVLAGALLGLWHP